MSVREISGNPLALRPRVVSLHNAMMRGSAEHEFQPHKICLIPMGLLKR
jgi:hypothetical protein